MRTWITTIVFAALFAVSGCTSVDPISPCSCGTGSANFNKFYVIGDSYTAGIQNGGLVAGFQQASYAALLAQAVRAPSFAMPLIFEPGIPPLMFVASYVPLALDTLAGVGAPTNSTHPAAYNNLGIPSARVNDLLSKSPAPDPNPFYQIVLRNPAFGTSAVGQAAGAQPTFLAAWMGMSDVYLSAQAGTDLAMTPVASFESDYRTAIDALRAAAGAMVAANIPDIVTIPFFTTIPRILVDPVTRQPILIGGNPVPLLGEFQGGSGPLPSGTLLTLPAATLLAQGIGVPVVAGGTGNPLPDAVVIDPTELGNIRARIGAFNTVIDSICTNRGIPVVDAFAKFNALAASGVEIRGETYTTDYISGGLFSVDGLHPSALGHWTVAREFIRVINASYAASIPDPPLPIGPLR
ncbi:MAG: SGNH/GDSL hydrolase family protein [Candidatus Krumholzibacteria bacterium]|nr:SGNH/GDSL hydrolase family protein [Candidatus Krumholzibacteria bacterium]